MLMFPSLVIYLLGLKMARRKERSIEQGKSLFDPPTIGGGLVYPLNYEMV
jgi:hypothetical protein